jgi:hypothetical protein
MRQGNRIGLAIVLACVFTPNLVFAGTLPVWGSQVWGSQGVSSDPVFNFDSDVVGKATPFTDTVSGLGATFTSSGDPGGFVVSPSFFSTLTGNVLLDPGPAGLNNLTLTIVFSTLQNNISMTFATNSGAGVPFNLNAFNGGSAVGSASATGVIPAGFFFPEGVINFDGPAFNRVVLSSPAALDFAIDNISVNVPEPGSLSLLAFGAFGAIAITRLRRLRVATEGCVA